MSDDMKPFGDLAKRVVDKSAPQPIQTRYRGVTYRSRTEARWAVFFDTLEVKFQYEPEGFDVGAGLWYLPDFLIPSWRLYIEVKAAGHTLTDTETRKARGCAEATGTPLLVVFGDPGLGQGRLFSSMPDEYGSPENSVIRNCRACDSLVVWSYSDCWYGSAPLGPCENPIKCGEKNCESNIGEKLERAIDAARSERFSREKNNQEGAA